MSPLTIECVVPAAETVPSSPTLTTTISRRASRVGVRVSATRSSMSALPAGTAAPTIIRS